jgi:hypothetical protein
VNYSELDEDELGDGKLESEDELLELELDELELDELEELQEEKQEDNDSLKDELKYPSPAAYALSSPSAVIQE